MFGLHWIRVVIVACAAITAIGTCMPWLVGVPPDLLHFGGGTIVGVTTMQGAIVLGLMGAVITIVVWPPRERVPRRAALAGVIALAFLSLVSASVVLGTSKAEIYEAIEHAAPSPEAANAAIAAVGDRLRNFDMGAGGVVVFLGVSMVVLASLVGLFLRRSPRSHRTAPMPMPQ